MESNVKKRRPSAIHNKGEQEKFSRRLIRAVARMLLHEKRNEAEVWEGLKKQTGFDCKELWNRMYALTLKKLDRLLEAEDQVDRLPAAARMTITDWLLFDTVIVHQDIDVIGMTVTSTEDRKLLVDLFELVEKFRLEFLAGDQLADAWSAATVYYNQENRQCTPMLLQRRWYQLKLATRARFYKFWSVYKGVFKYLSHSEPYKPTPLQTKIATRYKPLVVTHFMSWENLIQNKLVILPEEFEIKGLQKQEMITESSPDVMCVEPDVETINLDDDSDTELEYRKSSQNDDLAVVTVKQEPRDDEMAIDESTPYQNRQDKITHCAEAVMEATTTVLEEIDLAHDKDSFITSNSDEGDTLVTDDKKIVVETEIIENISSAIVEASSIQGETGSYLTKESGVVGDQRHKSMIDNADVVAIDNKDVILTGNTNVEEDVEFVKITKEPELVLPQITSVFGGFNDSNENLAKISLLTSQVTNNDKDVVLQNDSNSNNSLKNIAIISSSNSLSDYPMKTLDSANNINDDTTSKQSTNTNSTTQTLVSKPNMESHVSKNMWFGELSNDIDFVDDGIQLIDDSIAYQDEEPSYEDDGVSNEITSDIKIEENEKGKEEDTNNENNKFDKKLLMVPVVYTVKLEDMGVLTTDLNHVHDKSLIDIISSKSKVVLKEIDAVSDVSENMSANVKRVKLSSYILHKPRSRTYNPIQLCKNPDFNTRLKRLNVGFFSSSRNRLLFKACQPVTIDVSKAFEDRLVNGTMYLNIEEGNLGVEGSFKEKDANKCQENSSVLPSALPAQSLIDNTEGEIVPTLPPVNTNVLEAALTCERKKVINLPDITEVRRINQNLLTAQVTPMQNTNDASPSNNQATASLISLNDNPTTSKAGPASRKRAIDGQEENTVNTVRSNTLLGIDSNTPRNKELWKTGHKVVPWKSRQIRPEISWINISSGIYTPDTLLALDALNKMLCILTEGDKDFAIESKSKKKKYREFSGIGIEVKDKKTAASDDETQQSSNVVTIPRTKRKTHCCWARGRIYQLKFSRKRIAKHMCPFPLCLCCCKYQLLQYYNRIRDSGMDVGKILGCGNEANNKATKNKITTEKKDVAVDVAELIPIHTLTPESVTTNENEPTKSLEQKTVNEADVTLYHCESTSSEIISSHKSTVDEMPTHCDKSIQNELEKYNDNCSTLGANVSVRTSEDSPAENVNLSNNTPTTSNPDTNYIAPLKKPRIRIESSSRHKSTSSSRHKNDVNATHQTLKSTYAENIACQEEVAMPPLQHITGFSKNTKMIAMNTSNINIAKEIHSEGAVRVRNDLSKPLKFVKIKKVQNSASSQKLLYLNSKQIAEFPSDNPIHLGKNKILLTNLKFPPNFKAFESYERNLKQTMALPKGIKLILQLNGRLTYSQDRGAIISKEFIAAMPLLISAIQQQIDATSVITPCPVPPLKPYSNNDVICLSDDETLDVVNKGNKNETSEEPSGLPSSDYQNTSSENLLSQPEQQTNYLEITNDSDSCNGEKRSTLIEIESATNGERLTAANIKECIKNQSKTEEDSIKSPNENINLKLNEYGQEGKSTNIDASLQMTQKYPETGNTTQENEFLPKNINENKKTQLEITLESTETSSENIDIKLKDNEDKESNSKTKNILSDLMAMSGISPTTVAQESPLESNPREIVTDQEPIEGKAPGLLPELQYTLTPITSLSELKFACIHNGSFYKLDLETRLLLPINVCMKNIFERPRESISNKPRLSSTIETMIDLTNEDVSDEPTISRNNSLLIINEPGESSDTNIADTDNTVEIDNNEYIYHSQNIAPNTVEREFTVENVKPIKLFTVAPAILKRKLHDIRKRVIESQKKQNSTKPRRKQRKQSLLKTLGQEATLNNYLLNPNFGRFNFEGSSSDVVDSSSDEETLANIATKKRQMEKALQDAAVHNGQNDDKIALPLTEVIDDPNASHETVDQISGEVDESMNAPEVVMEYLDEELLNEGEQDDEACILGV